MKYGIRSVLRTPGRTLLFFLLITVTGGFLSLGVSMYKSAGDMLLQADNAFLTAGEFTFIDGNYPSSAVYDEKLNAAAGQFDSSFFAGQSQVLFYENNVGLRANVEGYTPRQLANKKVAILLVNIGNAADELGAMNCTVEKSYFCGWDDALDGKLLYLYPPREQLAADLQALFDSSETAVSVFGNEEITIAQGMSAADYFTEGSRALIIGESVNGLSATLSFSPYDNIPPELMECLGPLAAGRQTIIPLGEEEMPSAAQNAFAQEAASYYAVQNTSISINVTQNIEAVDSFHSGNYSLKDGSTFTPEDYAAGNACIIPAEILKGLNVEVGDEITCFIHQPVKGQGPPLATYSPREGFAATLNLTVRGIYHGADPSAPIYIAGNGSPWATPSVGQYTLGRVVVKNGQAESYYNAVAPHLPPGVNLTLYDQGYAQAVLPIYSMQETALTIMFTCLVCCGLVLVFFGYFYVLRNGVSVRILLALGAGKRRVFAYLLSGSGAIALAGALAGGVLGLALSRALILFIWAAAENGSRFDRRFSLNGYGIRGTTFSAMPGINLLWLLLAALAVFLAALLLCFIFCAATLRAENPHLRFHRQARAAARLRRRQEKAPRRALGATLSAGLPGVSPRFALRSLLRGGRRQLAVPMVFAALLAFVCFFFSLRSGYQTELAQVYDTIPVYLRITDMRGRYGLKFSINMEDIRAIEATGFVAESCYTYSNYYGLNGRVAFADGTPDPEFAKKTYADFYSVPYGGFVKETFESRLRSQFNQLIVTNSIAGTPEFAFSAAPEITYAEGYGPETFAQDSMQWWSVGGTSYTGQRLIINAGPEVLVYEDYMEYNRKYLTDIQRIYNTLSPEERRLQEHPPCFVSQSFLDKNGLSLGETIHLSVFYQLQAPNGEKLTLDAEMTAPVIAGVFTGGGTSQTIYLPWSEHLTRYADSANFLLKNTGDLSTLKDWLAENYSPVNRAGMVRKWVTVDDAALHEAVDSLTRHILYMNLLFPVVMALSGLVGFLVANMLLKSRKKELAILRGLGTPRGKVFFAFFIEQGLLCIPGLLLGCGLGALLAGGVEAIRVWIPLLFLLCYLLGAALAIRQMQKAVLLSSLTDKENG